MTEQRAGPGNRGRGGRGRGRGRSRGGRGRGRGRSDQQDDPPAANNLEQQERGKSGTTGEIVTRGGGGRKNGRGRGKGREQRGGGGRGRGRVGGVPTEQDSSKIDENSNKGRPTASTNDSNVQGKKGKGGQKDNQTNVDANVKTKIQKGKNDPSNKSKSAATKSKGKDPSSSSTPLIPSVPPSQPQQTSDINYGKGQSIKVLHVAEKPSIAQAIAQGLCNGKADYRSKSLPVHEFDCDFPKAPHASKCTHKVTSVAGHVFSVDFPQQFQSWDSVDPGELFYAPVVRKPCKGSVVKHLQDEAKGCDFIILWLDCDREGENISFEVLDCCMHNMKSASGDNFDRVYRAYFSAINPSDIQKAYKSLGKPDKNQSLSVDARQELDLKVGVAFSRFQTRFFQGRYGDLNSMVLSYGPCQTPTLGFCVQRHIDIETFKPEPFWVLELGVSKRGRKLRALWNSGRSFNKNRVERLLEQARETDSTILVSDVVTKDKKQGRPTPMNTVAMLKACSKALGIGPHSAMQAAERLYLSGYLSYPRTESTAYPNSFDIKASLNLQKMDNRWGTFVQALLRDGHNKPRGGVDMGGTFVY